MGWFEPSLPPDHGIWWALSPAGTPLAWSGTLASMSAHGRHVLAYEVLDGGGWQLVPFYAFSGDRSGASSCSGACAVRWPPVLTSGTPGVEGLAQAGAPGAPRRPDGTVQVTYQGRPLYLYSDEATVKDPHDSAYHATGSGNDLPGPRAGASTSSRREARPRRGLELAGVESNPACLRRNHRRLVRGSHEQAVAALTGGTRSRHRVPAAVPGQVSLGCRCRA